MPKISRRQEKIRLNKIRTLLAEGMNKEEVCDKMQIHPKTYTRYLNMVREQLIGDFDGKKVIDLWTAHKTRMEGIITECYAKLAMGPASDVSPDKLYRTIQQASESITDMGIKVGIVPTVAQRLSVDVTEKKEDDKLRELITGYRAEISETVPKESTEETN